MAQQTHEQRVEQRDDLQKGVGSVDYMGGERWTKRSWPNELIMGTARLISLRILSSP